MRTAAGSIAVLGGRLVRLFDGQDDACPPYGNTGVHFFDRCHIDSRIDAK